eukprot:758026-Hanusia_phi.AAC.2
MLAAERRYPARMTSWRYLTTEQSGDRIVVEVELDISNVDWTYAPGDSIGIDCYNEEAVVRRLLGRLGEDPERLVTIGAKSSGPSSTPAVPQHLEGLGSVSLLRLVQRFVDIRSIPKKAVLRLMADHCSDAGEADDLYFLSSIKGKDRFKQEIELECNTIDEILARYPSCKPPLALLLQVLPALSPRFYSIASSPLVQPSRVRFAFSVVRWKTPKGVERKGLCTNWLHDLCTEWHRKEQMEGGSGPMLDVFFAPSKDFKLPEDSSCPIIMVGPGTGVAPFVGFLQHRNTLAEERKAEQQAMGDRCVGRWRGMMMELEDETVEEAPQGQMWLFFGCRHPDQDYLYKQELLKLQRDDAVQLSVAFSRYTDKKVYVQHKMEEAGEELVKLLLRADSLFYVCGDGAHMAKDVRATVVRLLARHGGMEAMEAEKLVSGWTAKGKYLQDIWS